jgi:hypothetical protein
MSGLSGTRTFTLAAALVGTVLAVGCQLVSGVADMQFGAGGSGGASSAASSGGDGGSGGAMPPTPCKTASDCPAPENPCEAPICLGNVCGLVAVPAGSKAALSAQVAGDCLELVCAGDGSAV